MQENFAAAMAIVLKFEGGYSNNPADPGGATNFGVTQGVFTAWLDKDKLPRRDVRSIRTDEVQQIYRGQYWDSAHCDELPAGVDLVVFDGAVNSGAVQATKWLQRALGVDADGKVGAKTRAALAAVTDNTALIRAVVERRRAFLRALRTFRTFGKGWMARCDKVEQLALAMAAGVPPVVSDLPADAGRKAVIADAKPIPATAPQAGSAGIGTAAAVTVKAGWTSVRDPLDQIRTNVDGLPFVHHAMDAVLTWGDKGSNVVMALGALAAVGAGGWYAFNRQRAAKLRDALDINVTSPGPTPAMQVALGTAP